MQQLSVNKQQKKKLHKNYLKAHKVLYILPYIMIILAILFSIGLLIYGFGNENAFIVRDVTDSDFGKKNMMLLFFILGTGDIILTFLCLVLKITTNRISGRNISERINETLLIKNDCIEYGYQNYAGSIGGDRVVVQIPFRYIKKIIFNNATKETVFKGKYTSKYYEDYKTKTTRADDTLFSDDFIIFDYFEPSLVNSLRKVGLEVTRIE